MSSVIANMSMSLDGFVADRHGRVDQLFEWYSAGEETVTMPGDGREFRTSKASAQGLQDAVERTGALVCGRRLFDLTQGWGGHHPAEAPVFVVTHRPPRELASPGPRVHPRRCRGSRQPSPCRGR